MTDLSVILQANRSPRYCALDRLEAFVDTTQYDGRPDWFDGSEQAPPLRERRPCISYPIVRGAIDSNVDLCLGEGKFPTFELTDGDDGDDNSESDSLAEADREFVTGGFKKLEDIAKLRRAFRQAFATAQGQGTAVVIGGMRDGEPFIDVEKAKRCEPFSLAADGTVQSLRIQYVYTVDVQDRDGKWCKEARLYRREIDATKDVTYAPIKAQPDGRVPTEWPVAEEIVHGLGFCPVIWYRHMVGCSTQGDIDGRAIHQHHLDEITALDMALSQWHRAAFFAGDPQGYEIGVDDEDGPMARGRTTVPLQDLSTPKGGPVGKENRPNGRWVGGEAKKARKKGPGEWWQYTSPDVKVGMLTLPGDALQALQDHARDLRDKIAEGLGVVFTDPESVRFASVLSGKAQQMLRQRQLDRCDQYREDMADGLIRPALYMLFRVMRAVPPKSRVLRRLMVALSKLGPRPSISLKWGDYYEPDPAEQKLAAEFLQAADKVIAIPDRIKLQKLARSLDIENVTAVLEEIRAERAVREEKARDQAEAGARALLEAAHGGKVENANRSRRGASAQPDAGGRRGVAAPTAASGAPVRGGG